LNIQQLLEELYIQEIYADNAIESAITSTANRPTTPSGQQHHLNMSTFKLNSSSSPSSINNVMNGGCGTSKNNSFVNLQQENILNLTGGGLPNETIDSFENENNCTQDRVELIINERNSFNSSNIDFIQIQQQKRIAMENSNQIDSQTKRQIRMFNECNTGEEIMINNAVEQIKPQSIKIVNQISQQYPTNENGHYYQQQLNSHQKSLSYGNLTGNQPINLYNTSQINSHQNNNNNNNGNSSLKRCQILSTKGTYNQDHDVNHGHTLNANMKNLKLTQNHQFINSQSNGSNNSNSNGDHSGGDNDSGISSMSSETAAAMTSALNSTLAAQNSFNYIQKPIIMGQQQQQRHQMFNNQQPQYNGQQYYSSNRQIYQTNGHSASSTNISIHTQNNSNVSSQSKAVLETLV